MLYEDITKRVRYETLIKDGRLHLRVYNGDLLIGTVADKRPTGAIVICPTGVPPKNASVNGGRARMIQVQRKGHFMFFIRNELRVLAPVSTDELLKAATPPPAMKADR